jgi:hypothetical protein
MTLSVGFMSSKGSSSFRLSFFPGVILLLESPMLLYGAVHGKLDLIHLDPCNKRYFLFSGTVQLTDI